MKEMEDNTQQMERYTMFLDWKNQYCQNDYPIQDNLRFQHNVHQIITGTFHRTRTKFFLICMEAQKTPIAKIIFFFKKYFSIGEKLPYNTVLVSAIIIHLSFSS